MKKKSIKKIMTFKQTTLKMLSLLFLFKCMNKMSMVNTYTKCDKYCINRVKIKNKYIKYNVTAKN